MEIDTFWTIQTKIRVRENDYRYGCCIWSYEQLDNNTINEIANKINNNPEYAIEDGMPYKLVSVGEVLEEL